MGRQSADFTLVEQDRTRIKDGDAGGGIEERRFPRPVGPDEADHLAGGNAQSDPLQRGNAAVAHDEFARLEHVRRYVRCHKPANPRGTKMMKASSSAPVVISR